MQLGVRFAAGLVGAFGSQRTASDSEVWLENGWGKSVRPT